MTDEQTQQQTVPVRPRLIAERYALLDELGRGGMGVVWRAEDRVIGRQVAVKELRLPEGAEDAGVFQERVLREVRTGGRLNDPAVVTVYDVVTDGDTSYIVMELVEAPTLSALVRQNGPLPAPQVAAIGEQVLAALRAAHEAGIVHRDVKPGNIMVAPNVRVKLTDFGIAQAVDDPRLTTSGMIVGSPAFMAPERVAGHAATPASDLWSLGATLFFAVEGQVAFERPTTAATLHAIVNEVPYLSRTQGPLASAIMGLLTANPEGRLTAEQAQGLLTTASQLAPQPTAVYTGIAPAARPTTKRTILRIGAALLGAGLLVGGFLAGQAVSKPEADAAKLPTLTYGAADADVTKFPSSSSSDTCYTKSLADMETSKAVKCEDLHYIEFYDSASTYGSSDSEAAVAKYPGRPALSAWAESRCAMTFHSNAISEQHRDSLNYQALIPAQAIWDQPGKDDPVRRIYCVASKRDGSPSTGSVATPLK